MNYYPLRTKLSMSAKANLVPKRGSYSVIWEWFGFEPDDSAQALVLCKVCMGNVKTCRGNTTNLFNHLRKMHPKEHAKSISMRAKFTDQQLRRARQEGSVKVERNKKTKSGRSSSDTKEVIEAAPLFGIHTFFSPPPPLLYLLPSFSLLCMVFLPQEFPIG